MTFSAKGFPNLAPDQVTNIPVPPDSQNKPQLDICTPNSVNLPWIKFQNKPHSDIYILDLQKYQLRLF